MTLQLPLPWYPVQISLSLRPVNQQEKSWPCGHWTVATRLSAHRQVLCWLLPSEELECFPRWRMHVHQTWAVSIEGVQKPCFLFSMPLSLCSISWSSSHRLPLAGFLCLFFCSCVSATLVRVLCVLWFLCFLSIFASS